MVRQLTDAVEVASWSAEQVVGIPTAYLWAFIRSVRARKALGTDGVGNTAEAAVENVFRASLAEIKGEFWMSGCADRRQHRRSCWLSRMCGCVGLIMLRTGRRGAKGEWAARYSSDSVTMYSAATS